jgi:hypothetical protein
MGAPYGFGVYSEELRLSQTPGGAGEGPRTGRGHALLTKEGSPVNLSVHQHGEYGVGILGSLIGHAGLSVEEFLDLLR